MPGWSIRSGLVLLLALATMASLQVPRAKAWTTLPCAGPTGVAQVVEASPQCIGHNLIRARGRLKAECVTHEPVAAAEYDDPKACGGNGAEYIAQARAATNLTAPASSTQWEVQTHGTKSGRADLTYETQHSVEVYEAKLATANGWGDPLGQAIGYVTALNSANGGGSFEPEAVLGDTALLDFYDLFLVRNGTTCEVGDETEYTYTMYVSYLKEPGVIAAYPYQLDCFDPLTEPIPKPAEQATWQGIPVPLDQAWNRMLEHDSNARMRTWDDRPIVTPVNGLPDTPPAQKPTPPSGPPNPPSPPSSAPPNTTPPGPGPGPNSGPDSGPGAPSTNPIDSRGGGDPHMATFDGLAYDLMSIGEFELAESDSLGLDVQIRTAKWGDNAAVIQRFAAEVNGYDVEVDATNHLVVIDGRSTDLDSGNYIDLGNNAWVWRDGDAYTVTLPGDGSRPQIWASGYSVQVNTPHASDLVGLEGNGDGNPNNDLLTSGGDPLPNANASTIHSTFADSWRVDDSDTLFTYPDGESTADFTDTSWPLQIPTLHELDDQTLAQATTACTDGGVMDGPQFDECLIDWAQTRSDQFVASMAQQTAPLTEPGARTVGAAGRDSEDFDSSVAPNYGSARYGTNPSTGTYAGPFSRNDRYVYYLPSLPPHLNATLSFDVVALGDWTAFDGSTVNVTVDGNVVWSGNPAAATPTATGTTAGGQPYAIYPVTVTVPHVDDQLRVGISAELPLGAQAWGIDNVTTQLAVVPPQQFEPTLPATITDGTPAAGAGNLETVVSEDDYAFTTSSTTTVEIAASECDSSLGGSLNYVLTDTGSGRTVTNNWVDCDSDKQVVDVPAGDYQLAIIDKGRSGAYKLKLDAVAPQQFDVSLPLQVSDGRPSTGAGNMETPASEDIYTFSVAAPGTMQLDLGSCVGLNGYGVFLTLQDVATGHTAWSGWSLCDRSFTIPDLDAGDYRLVANHGGETGTYELGVGLVPAPQSFALTSLPQTITDGDPATGAGNLETSSSEDDYTFTTGSETTLEVAPSQCASSLGGSLKYVLTDTGSGQTVTTDWVTCGSDKQVVSLPAGDYQLAVTDTGKHGAYTLKVDAVAPQRFDVSLPLEVSDGQPNTGAGNMENPASEDVYTFSLDAAGALQLDIGHCTGLNGYGVFLTLQNVATGATAWSGWSLCDRSFNVPGLDAGDYRLVASHGGETGTYELGVEIVPPAQSFALTSLPQTITNGDPSAGAGNFETTSSEDDYTFTTTTAGTLDVALSDCTGSLSGSSMHWVLTADGDGHTVADNWQSCTSDGPGGNLPAGNYKLAITDNGARGTYKLRVDSVNPQHFAVDLPMSVSNGSPSAGAGNLETAVSKDVYTFNVPAAGNLHLDVSSCATGWGWFQYELTDTSDGHVVASDWDYGCSALTIRDVPAGDYDLTISDPKGGGTYNLSATLQPAPQPFAIPTPTTVSDGVPSTGAGNLETTSSEDDYTFTTAKTTAMELDLSGCDPGLSGGVNFTVTGGADHHRVDGGWLSCNNSETISDVPVGDYQVAVTQNGHTGTYHLQIAAEAPQSFDTTLPFEASDGVPSAGAGHLEFAVSKDVYAFNVSVAGNLHLDTPSCATGWGWLHYELTDASDDHVVASDWDYCSAMAINNVPAGDYKLTISDPKGGGTYDLSVAMQPAPQTFAVSTPATVSDGVPSAGAGNLETSSSEDDYTFTTTTTTADELYLSGCDGSLSGGVNFTVTGGADHHRVDGGWLSCNNTETISDVPAGDYQVAVTQPGHTGGYHLRIAAEAPQSFAMTLPFSASDGVPSAGAGHLEFSVSKDVYTFNVATASDLHLDVSSCATGWGWLQYELTDASDGHVVASDWDYSCSALTISNVPAGDYRLTISDPRGGGTYNLAVSTE
jgi:hypothetical protein